MRFHYRTSIFEVLFVHVSLTIDAAEFFGFLLDLLRQVIWSFLFLHVGIFSSENEVWILRGKNDLLRFWVNHIISAILIAVFTVTLISRNSPVQKWCRGCAAGGSCNFPLKYHCKMNGSCGTAEQNHILLVAQPQCSCSFLC